MTSEKRSYVADSDCMQFSTQETSPDESTSGENSNGNTIPALTDENPTDISSSISSSLPSVLYDAIPPLQDQRSIVANMWARFSNEKKEGDVVYIIPESWLSLFQDPLVTDYRAVPPLNIASIVVDYDHFILQDYSRQPYTAVPAKIFNLLQQWYGLTPDSKPLPAYIVIDKKKQLVVEYDRPRFRIHHLTTNENSSQYSISMRNAAEAKLSNMFTLSSLATTKDVVQRAIDLFLSKEPQFDKESYYFRVWYINDDGNNVKTSNILQNSYTISPSTFLELTYKHKITKNMFTRRLKDLNSHVINLAIEVKRKSGTQHWPSNFFHYFPLQSSPGITGLANLGNTCYMNSALQCLLHIQDLNEYFLYGGYEDEINNDNPLGYKGHVAHAFGHLVQSLFSPSYGINSFFAPRNFKNTIGHYNQLFAGFGQQDSQEFLAFILDGLHEDLNRVIKKPYLEKPELPEGSPVDENKIIELANETWDYVKKRNDSVIMDLFVGLYKSTLICPNCQHVSVTFDPYNDLTLPLPIENYWTCKVLIFPQNSPPCTLEIELLKNSTYQELKEYIAKQASMNADDLIGCEIFNHQFYNNYESNMEAEYLPISELISENDTVVFYELIRNPDDIVVPIFNTRIEDGYKTPRLFGYPFFIALSKDEQYSYGSIRKKIERCYQNFSGGFSEFPILSKVSENYGLDSLPLLSKKFPKEELDIVTKELEFINPEISPDNFFKIMLLKNEALHNHTTRTPRFNNASLKNSNSPAGKIWTPTSVSSINYNNSEEITQFLPEVVKTAYYYSEIKNDTGMDDSDEVVDNNDESSIDSETKSTSDESMTTSTEVLNGLSHLEMSSLVESHTALICEWNTGKDQEVFDLEYGVNWNSPAVLDNIALTKAREERSEKEQTQITLDSCLRLFSQPEVLSSADSWYCPKCKEHTQASKQIELWNTPDILLIHLKRFENQRSFSDKIDATVHFPIEGLDMSPYLSYQNEMSNDIYDLIAVDNHYGGLGGGHYTAYCRNFVDGKWYYFDDSRVTETSPENSVAGSAYLLFYKRRSSTVKVEKNEKLRDIIETSRKSFEQKQAELHKKVDALYEIAHSDTEDDTESALEDEAVMQNKTVEERITIENEEWEAGKRSNSVELPGNRLIENDAKLQSDEDVNEEFDETILEEANGQELNDELVNEAKISEPELSLKDNKFQLEYNVSSLEVGENISTLDSHDSSRRKLRLLEKVYVPESPNKDSSKGSSPEEQKMT